MKFVLVLSFIVLAFAVAFKLGSSRAKRRRQCRRKRSVATTRFNDPVGGRALVVEAVAVGRRGRVRFQGTTWPATTSAGSFGIGESVEIAGRDNITMTVERCRPTIRRNDTSAVPVETY